MKRIILNLKIALGALGNYRLRTALAVLGVFFGTLSLVIVGNLSDSLSLKTEQEIDNLGKDLVIVFSGQLRQHGPRGSLTSRAATLTQEDATAISEGLPAAMQVSPSGMKAFPIRYRNVVLKAVAVNGVTPNFTAVRNFEIAAGSPLADDDETNQRKVALLGPTTAEKLFGTENPVGKTILIWRVPCQVIGVTVAKGSDISGTDQDNQIFVPLKTFLRTFTNQEYLNAIYIQAADENAIPSLQNNVKALLRIRHKIGAGMKDDFTVVDLKDVNTLKNDAMGMIKILGRTAAAASFLIGSLGILSIMILIVNERRIEIGIRRAVGSRKRDIILQFLLESSFISVTGGLIGILAGILASLLIARILDYPATISLPGLILSFAASALSGIIAGIYPSVKAIQINPVDIIRS
jgi:putative ABC transport system permease protein